MLPQKRSDNLSRLALSDVPFDRVIWDARQCAAYLGQEKSSFLKRTQFAPGFPKRLPIAGQPRWSALEVSDWAFGKKSRQNPVREGAAA